MKKFGILFALIAIMAMAGTAFAAIGENEVSFDVYLSAIDDTKPSQVGWIVPFGSGGIGREHEGRVGLYLGEVIKFVITSPDGATWGTNLNPSSAYFTLDATVGNTVSGHFAPGIMKSSDVLDGSCSIVVLSSDTGYDATYKYLVRSDDIFSPCRELKTQLNPYNPFVFQSGDNKIAEVSRDIAVAWPERDGGTIIGFTARFTNVSFAADSQISTDVFSNTIKFNGNKIGLVISGDPFTDTKIENLAKLNVSLDYTGNDGIARSADVAGYLLGVILSANTNKPIESVALDKTVVTLTTSGGLKTAELTATMTPSDASSPAYTWTTSDQTKVTVTGSGSSATISAVAVGTATITVSVNAGGVTRTATCAVTVKEGDIPQPPVPVEPKAPVGTPSNVVPTKPDTTSVPNLAVSAMKSTGITASDFEELGGVVLPKGQVMADAAGVTQDKVISLPFFTAPVESGKIAMVGFKVKGSELKVKSNKAKDIKVLKKFSSTGKGYFKYQSDPAQFGDECFTVLADGTNTVVTDIDAARTYDLVLFIKQGGRFDLSGRASHVADPAAIVASEETPPANVGSGCNAAFAPLALLLLAAPLFFRKKK